MRVQCSSQVSDHTSEGIKISSEKKEAVSPHQVGQAKICVYVQSELPFLPARHKISECNTNSEILNVPRINPSLLDRASVWHSCNASRRDTRHTKVGKVRHGFVVVVGGGGGVGWWWCRWAAGQDKK